MTVDNTKKNFHEAKKQFMNNKRAKIHSKSSKTSTMMTIEGLVKIKREISQIATIFLLTLICKHVILWQCERLKNLMGFVCGWRSLKSRNLLNFKIGNLTLELHHAIFNLSYILYCYKFFPVIDKVLHMPVIIQL